VKKTFSSVDEVFSNRIFLIRGLEAVAGEFDSRISSVKQKISIIRLIISSFVSSLNFYLK